MAKHSLEFNKAAAGVLLAGVIAMICGFAADGLYPEKENANRGFAVEVAEAAAADGGGAKAEVDIATLLASADAARGDAAAHKKCTSCHTLEQGGANKVGPNLFAVAGRKIGSAAGFTYSDAVKAKGGTWGYDELNQWLKAPGNYIKGTKMAYAGVKNDAERADIIMYLKSISASAPALPTPAKAK